MLFDFNKYELKKEAMSELLKVSSRIKEYPGAKIIISGHTDSIGTDDLTKSFQKIGQYLSGIF